jgi:glucan phosphoethanolaminetransferase (alkaline phosphatase superfamily)
VTGQDAAEQRWYLDLLKRFLDENPAVPRAAIEEPAEIVGFIAANAPAATRNRWLHEIVLLGSARGRGSNKNYGLWALIAAGVIIAALLFYGIFLKDDFVASLSEARNARGLITFLFSVGTISVIIVIAIACFWIKIEEIEKRVTSAKDILTLLIGIFGTILGFYFGSENATANRQANQPPTETSAPAGQ